MCLRKQKCMPYYIFLVNILRGKKTNPALEKSTQNAACPTNTRYTPATSTCGRDDKGFHQQQKRIRNAGQLKMEETYCDKHTFSIIHKQPFVFRGMEKLGHLRNKAYDPATKGRTL